MCKVLIVDDEAAIREGLKYVINWREYGFEIVGTAQNGDIGLLKIQELRPDVIITDIKMPGKNGIEMIESARKIMPHFYTIFLSGYSDFEFARKAIQLGAVNYLLKPIDEDELVQLLQTIKEKEKLKQVSIYGSQWYDKLFGSDNYGINTHAFIRLMRISTGNHLEELCNELRQAGVSTEVIYHQDFYYIVMLYDENFIDAYFELLFTQYFDQEEVFLTTSHRAYNNLKPLVHEIEQLSDLTFLWPKQYLSKEHIARIRGMIVQEETGREDILKSIFSNTVHSTTISEYSNFFYHQLLPTSEIKWRVICDMSWLYQQVEGKIPVELDWDSETFHQSIYEATNIIDLQTTMLEEIQSLSRLVAIGLNRVDIIQELINYTRQNYQEPLTLKRVGEIFNYNSAYLGKKFRKETGKNYLTFLDEVRMNKAKEVLSHSNFMIYEVAEMVGYTNSDYFYKKFKAHYNISPNEFRNTLLSAN